MHTYHISHIFNDDHLPPFTMAVTIIILQGSFARFRSVSLPNQKEFNRQSKKMVTKFSEKTISQNTAFVYCTALHNPAISHVILSQIIDTARNPYCILSDQNTYNSSCFLLW